ncbi:SDR family NAD(P)-dependent oxidoreductase [Companilactobacillus sp. HBUAS59699]|uniref:SDR family NAD(P)-dependent oxidoreductase n=1 Tax=Companilactobacillus sp. HBUAS59699 TaxID=3109358 RepID=UPI002FF2D76C
MNIAIVTGASSGLGKVFFEQLIKRYTSLDEVWIVARRLERLEELADKFSNRKIRVFSLDLSEPESFDTLSHSLETLKPTVKILINNAGFDRTGLFHKMKPQNIQAMINLNVMGMTLLNRICLPYMKRGSYEIITGSIGGFIPLPGSAVYSASKAYTRFLARALHEEEKSRGVNVMLLSPGNMDTEMLKRSEIHGKLSFLPYLDLQKETVKAMKKAEKGAAVYTPLAFYKAYRIFGKIVPSALAVKFTKVEIK